MAAHVHEGARHIQLHHRAATQRQVDACVDVTGALSLGVAAEPVVFSAATASVRSDDGVGVASKRRWLQTPTSV